VLKSFFHIEAKVEATEPEEIGVEHLLREIKEIPLNSLNSSILGKVQALRGLEGKISEIVEYLRDVREGRLPANNKVMFLLQEIVNLLPNLNSEDLVRSFAAKNNDMLFAVYICAMVRCVLSLHTLIFVSKSNEEKEKDLEQQREKERQAKEEKKK
jgi:26S proteasome regulatory subunit N8